VALKLYSNSWRIKGVATTPKKKAQNGDVVCILLYRSQSISLGDLIIFPTTSKSLPQPYRAIDSPGFGNNNNKALGQKGEHWPADFFNSCHQLTVSKKNCYGARIQDIQTTDLGSDTRAISLIGNP